MISRVCFIAFFSFPLYSLTDLTWNQPGFHNLSCKTNLGTRPALVSDKANAIEIAKIVPLAKKEALIATTAEGIEIKIAQEAVDTFAKHVTHKSSNPKAIRSLTQKAGEIAESGAKRVVESVANMKEFFELPFGKQLKNMCRKTKYRYDGQSVYKVTGKLKNLDKGYLFYLDKKHLDHFEVFSGKRFKFVLNLDGTINESKTLAGLGRKLTL